MFCEYASKEVIRQNIEDEYADELSNGISAEQIYEDYNEGIWGSVNYVYFYILSGIEVLANGEDITKQKGKYIVAPDLIHSELSTDMPYPIEFRFIREMDYYGWVELDVDDFDPKKLQLRKSVYEFNDIPFAIDAMCIVYDGKLIELNTDEMFDCYDRWGYGKDQAIILDK